MKRPTCPKCLIKMKRRQSNFKPGVYWWGCINFPLCRFTCAEHPDGTMMSTPADAFTKRMRIKAHEAFDALWKSRRISRKHAYKIMRELMGMTKEEAHIGMFDAHTCRTLIERLDGLEWKGTLFTNKTSDEKTSQ
jgi:ssDNA-binding Zn-finger/Zn-ribbon topoisomerase 1